MIPVYSAWCIQAVSDMIGILKNTCQNEMKSFLMPHKENIFLEKANDLA